MSYRRNPPSLFRPTASPGDYDVEYACAKKVAQKGSNEPMTVIEVKRVSPEEYAKSLGLPESENYQLRDMLAAGQIPEQVNVSGMLDSQDPTDYQNQEFVNTAFDKLSEGVKESEPASSEPAPVVEPSNAE